MPPAEVQSESMLLEEKHSVWQQFLNVLLLPQRFVVSVCVAHAAIVAETDRADKYVAC